MPVQIRLLQEYRDQTGRTWTLPADDPTLMNVPDWSLRLDVERGEETDLVGHAVWELASTGIVCFDGDNTAHSGDDSWNPSYMDGREYRGRAVLDGFTAGQLEQIRAGVAKAGADTPHSEGAQR